MSDSLPVPIGGTALPQIRDELASASRYALAEKSDATRRAYRSDFDHFTTWCDARGVEPLPASIDTTAAYLAALADGGLKASTITRRAAAIGYAHRLRGAEPPTNAEPVKAVLRGIRRQIGVAVDFKAPATAPALTRMLKRIPSDTLGGKRDRALLTIGFAAALRRSELVALNVADLELLERGIIIHIRRSKTDQEGEGEQVPVPTGKRLKPVDALQAWLAAAGITEGAIFRSIGKGDRIGSRLTDRSVANIVKQYAKAAGLNPEIYSGHSLRAGFVTTALENGADLLKTMDITRHREVKTLKRYDRRAKAFKDHAGQSFL